MTSTLNIICYQPVCHYVAPLLGVIRINATPEHTIANFCGHISHGKKSTGNHFRANEKSACPIINLPLYKKISPFYWGRKFNTVIPPHGGFFTGRHFHVTPGPTLRWNQLYVICHAYMPNPSKRSSKYWQQNNDHLLNAELDMWEIIYRQ